MELWPHVEPLLLRALDYVDDKYKTEDILAALLKREMQLWVTFGDYPTVRSFCITAIMQYPQQARLCILFSSGLELIDCLPHLEIMTAFAKEKNCKKIEIWGRPGWEKILKPYGYEKIHTVFTLELPTTH